MTGLEGFSISPQQRRAWRREQTHGPLDLSAVYLWEGVLDTGLLQTALSHLLNRHDVLRTSLEVPQGRRNPIQVIREQPRFHWWEFGEETDVAAAAAAALDTADFDPNVLPEFPIQADRRPRFMLIRIHAERHLILCRLPVYLADRHSLLLLGREWFFSYLRSPDDPKKEEPLQYYQYSEWLAELAGEDEGGKAFWIDRRGESQPKPLLTEAPIEGPILVERVFYRITSPPAARAESIADEPKETFFLACWWLLLSRLAPGEAISLAVGFDGRSFEELQEAIGPFFRFLPLTLTPTSRTLFPEFLNRVTELHQNARDWQQFFQLEDQGEPQQLRYGFRSLPAGETLCLDGLSFQSLWVSSHPEPLDLCLNLVRQPGTATRLVFRYDAALFSETRIAQIGERYLTLLNAIGEYSNRPLGQYSILGEAERHKLLRQVNQPDSPKPGPSLLDGFLGQVERTPDRVILLCGRNFLCLGALGMASERLARRLRERGAGPEKQVGLYFPRCNEMVTAILGTLKSGAAFLPLDPGLPPDRLDEILAQSDLSAMISLNAPTPERKVGSETLFLPDHPTVASREDAPLEPVPTDPNQAVYIIFTSGSTGRPKGITVQAGNLATYLEGIRERLHLEEGFSYAMVSGIAADLGYTGLFPPLIFGGRLHIIPDRWISHTRALSDFLERCPVDCLKITPSHLAALSQQQRPERLLPRRRLILGGESCPPELLADIDRWAPDLAVFNHYGPTETTIGVLTHARRDDARRDDARRDDARRDDARRGDTLPGAVQRGDAREFPLGRPLPNTRVYVLNPLLEPQPQGLIGELFIGGAQLARGYTGRPDLSAQGFLPDHLSGRSGGRLYRSGDLVLMDRQGRLHFRGRADDQIKIRGFRVELGEIEATLRQFPAVRQAVVLAWPGETPQDRLLAAYLTGDGLDPDPQTLRAFLEPRLPTYMLPASFTILEKMPLHGNGKIHRQALPQPGPAQSEQAIPPRNKTERRLADIWSAALKRPDVGVNQNFFSLGGHSITGTIVLSRINEGFDLDLPLATLFQEPTVERLALAVQRAALTKLGPEFLKVHLDPATLGEADPRDPEAMSAIFTDLDGGVLETLLAQAGQVERQRQPIPRQPRKQGSNLFPLSFSQQRLWFLHRLQGSSSVYNLPSALSLRGVVSLAALEQAITALSYRHEILRTVFIEKNGQPHQKVRIKRPLALRVTDLRHLEKDQRELLVRERAQSEAEHEFRLEKGPLWRIALLQVENERTILLLTMHHLISDGWSNGITINELAKLYQRYLTAWQSAGPPTALTPLPIQYGDFAAWQRKTLGSEGFRSKMDYWKNKLSGVPLIHGLHTDRPRPNHQTYRGGAVDFAWEQAQVAALKTLCAKMDCTLFMGLQAGFYALLGHFSNQTDVVIGSPVANRNRAEIEPLIGFFVNTLVLRGDLSGDPNFSGLLQRVRQTDLEAYEHQEIPFEQIVELIRPERSLSHSPVFQIMFLLQNAPGGALEVPGLEISSLGQDQKTSKFDLTLVLGELPGGGLLGSFEFNSDLFDAATMERLAIHLGIGLKNAAEQPDRPLSQISWLSRAQRHLLLETWNRTETKIDPALGVLQRFHHQARLRPSGIALIHEHRLLSYRSTAVMVLHLADELRKRGAAPEQPIGVRLAQTPLAALAMLAIFQSGAVYLPIDPALPEERMRFILKESAATLLLDRELMEKLSRGGRALISSGAMPPQTEEAAIAPPGSRLAYIIYTSGSTGQPKGVMLHHAGLNNQLFWRFRDFGITAEDRLLQTVSLSFDPSIWQILWPLCGGAQLMFADENSSGDMVRAARLMAERYVTVTATVPGVLRLWLEREDFCNIKCLHHLSCGGEAVSVALQREFLEKLGSRPVLFVVYGPTEVTIDASFRPARDRGDEHLVHIGKPLCNTRIYLLDLRLEPRPLGAPGHLFIGGTGLGRGYLARPDLTALAFIPNPFARNLHETRLYKTGDLARYLTDGSMDFLGRSDAQTKIRGFRIELGEVESRLLEHDQIDAAAVLARPDSKGEKRLVAYIQPSSEQADPPPSLSALTHHLKKKLPDYMLPGALVFLDRLPRTLSGKIDHRALPEPRWDHQTYRAPRRPLEEVIVTLWEDILGQSPIGIHDNFFRLGGHSLLATRVISRLNESFQLNLPLRDLFEAGDIEQLAKRVEWARTRKGSPSLPPLKKHDQNGQVLSYAQMRLWFLHQLGERNAAYHMPTAVRLEGPFSAQTLEQSLLFLTERHQVLRTVFPADQGIPRARLLEPELHLTALDLSGLNPESQREEPDRLLPEAARLPFYLEHQRPIRATLLRERDGVCHVWLILHHIVADGWSMGLFVSELSQIYNGLIRQQAIELPDLPLQYNDFAHWQQAALKGPAMAEQLTYWRNQLRGVPNGLDLPTDHARGTTRRFAGDEVWFRSPPESLARLHDFNRKHGVTSFMTLLTALNILFYRWTRQQDQVIGTVIAGRNRTGSEHLIGCFMNFLALRTRLRGDAPAFELLAQVRTHVFDAFDHQDYPFEKLVETINPDRDLSRDPIYNVALLLQNLPETPAFEGALKARSKTAAKKTALMDLRFIAHEGSDRLLIQCEFNTDLFQRETVTDLLEAYGDTLERLLQNPEQTPRQFPLPPTLTRQARQARARSEKGLLAVAATFTAEPLEAGLLFWMDHLNLPFQIQFAAYQQVFQELLDHNGSFAANHKGVNLVLIRPEDWLRFRTAGGAEQDRRIDEDLHQFTQQLVAALETAVRRDRVPYLIGLCPMSQNMAHHPLWGRSLRRAEAEICRALDKIAGLHLVNMKDWFPVYKTNTIDDPHGEQIGHVPYHSDYFATMATVLARKIRALHADPHKVLVLDCDETLWRGICGEDGPAGVVVDASRQALQRFLLKQRDAGMLLCLCSKNRERDVLEVFETHPNMLIRTKDLASWRVNWLPKSQNLYALAAELNLGIESLIFIDDNPVEIAEVRANCPEVLTVQLPVEQDPGRLAAHLWAFDRLRVTAEDQNRTERYRQNSQREHFRRQSLSYATFLSQLQLNIRFEAPGDEHLTRVAQLSQRTNQFNISGRRRNEPQLRDFLHHADHHCLIAHVSDKFGSYGIVGVLLMEETPQQLVLDSFLLSCRALGRGVEHAMLARAGALARQRGLGAVAIPFKGTAKNRPAAAFLESLTIPKPPPPGEERLFVLDAATLAALRFQPDRLTNSPAPAEKPTKKTASSWLQNEVLEGILSEFHHLEPILKAMARASRKQRTSAAPYRAPQTASEEILAGIWADVLGLDRVGRDDHFFDLKGHSLLATQVISRIKRIFSVALPLRAIFESPHLTALSRRIDLAKRIAQLQDLPPLRPAPRDQPLPLSYAQQRLWFLDAMGGTGTAYHLPTALRLLGPLQVMAIEQALTALSGRHESLRTRFDLTHEAPHQIIDPNHAYTLPLVDLSGLPAERAEAQMRSAHNRGAAHPFSLSQGPLWRAGLFRLGTDAHSIYFNMHHIISDGWSMGIMVREMGLFYKGFAENRPCVLPELAIQYADFAAWQRRWMDGDALQVQRDYWRRHLEGAPALLQLPTDRPRPPVQRYGGDLHYFELEGKLSSALKRLFREREITPFMGFQAAFACLLSRYSGQDEVLMGTSIAGRHYEELEPLIGFFVNTLVLRTDTGGNPDFVELLTRSRQEALNAYAHQDLPFEYILDLVRPERNTAYNPIFQVLFIFQNTPTGRSREQPFPLLQVKPLKAEHRAAMFDITLSIGESDDRYYGNLEYNTDLFRAAAITRFAGHFKRLLTKMAEAPNTPLSQLSLLSEEERIRQLLVWNLAEIPAYVADDMARWFGDVARRIPDRIALESGRSRLSFDQLRCNVEDLGRRLRCRGVGEEVPVVLCLSRSPRLIIAKLAVLQAGGAYVPLDPDTPVARMEFIIRDTAAPLILAESAYETKLSSLGPPLFLVDKPKADEPEVENSPPAGAGHGERLAYLIYTSGSTGQPKGVAVSHANLTRFIANAVHVFQITAEDRVLQFASAAFDTAVEEIYGSLCAGANLRLRDETMIDPRRLIERTRQWRLSLWDLPTALWHELTPLLSGSEEILPRCLRLVIIGGEAARLEAQRQWRAGAGTAIRLINTYGPTETTVSATHCELPAFPDRVPIGRPLPHGTVYVTDRHLNPQPQGVVGELLLGGESLARGYHRRPALSAVRFVPNPFPRVNHPSGAGSIANSGSRLYRSGDLVRFLPDGSLEFVGRIDFQIKLRGFRIELGEIEAALCGHPLVDDALVLYRTPETGAAELVSFVIPAACKHNAPAGETEPQSHAALAAYLHNLLPAYMVPGRFLFLPHLPKTQTGKIDRRALEDQLTRSPAREEASSETDLPRDLHELQLLLLFEKVLGRTGLGIHDNFFQNGGHSILAVRLMALIRKEFDLELPLTTLFQGPTPAQLRSFLHKNSPDRTPSALVPIRGEGHGPPFFCIHPIGGHVLCYMDLARELALPFYGLQTPVLHGGPRFESIELMAAHYLEHIKTVQPVGPYHLGGWSFGAFVAYEMAQQLRGNGEEVALLAFLDIQSPVDHRPLLSDAQLLTALVRERAAVFGKDLDVSTEILEPMSEPERLRLVLDLGKTAGLLAAEVGLEQVRRLWLVFRNNYRAAMKYRPQPYRGRIDLFKAQLRPSGETVDPALEWAELAGGGLTVHQVPGDHASMIRHPHVRSLADRLAEVLSGVQEPKTPAH